jgi:hypothetical protein
MRVRYGSLYSAYLGACQKIVSLRIVVSHRHFSPPFFKSTSGAKNLRVVT